MSIHMFQRQHVMLTRVLYFVALYSLNIERCSITSRTIQTVADSLVSGSVLSQICLGTLCNKLIDTKNVHFICCLTIFLTLVLFHRAQPPYIRKFPSKSVGQAYHFKEVYTSFRFNHAFPHG